MTLGNSLPPVVTDIFIEYLEEIALDTAEHKPANWFRSVEESFMVWTHGPARIQQCLHHFDSLEPTIKFTRKLKLMILFQSWTSRS
jgi:hypothetical protein